LGGEMNLTRQIYELTYRKKWWEQRQKEKKKKFDDSIEEPINAKDISPMSERASQINEMMKTGMTQREIAKTLGVTPRNISDMKSRHNLPR
jgi:DNA-binding NarL/FixJ family response regulator